MFEDLITKEVTSSNAHSLKKLDVDIEKFEADPFCPFCGSKDVQNTGGVFIPGKRFRATFHCSFCYNEWDVIFDKDTNVESVEAWS